MDIYVIYLSNLNLQHKTMLSNIPVLFVIKGIFRYEWDQEGTGGTDSVGKQWSFNLHEYISFSGEILMDMQSLPNIIWGRIITEYYYFFKLRYSHQQSCLKSLFRQTYSEAGRPIQKLYNMPNGSLRGLWVLLLKPLDYKQH